jgi:hypothetical protein
MIGDLQIERAGDVSGTRARVERLERANLEWAKANDALADEVERLTLENERLRQPRGLRAALAHAWHRLDG